MQRLLWLCAVTAALASCGDGSKTCGPDTREENGVCVAAIDCGPGTIANEDGNACVPDGSVVCSDGTMFDVASGTCVPSDAVCGDGTVLIDGVCRDPATVTPDAEESAEVNDSTGAGQITVPAIGADGFVIHGCITSRDSGATADLDPWLVNVTGPTLLEISADGVGGLAAGFLVAYSDNDPAMADYVRFGLNLVTDSAKRQVYLPAAGLYVLGMTDQRTLVGLGSAGTDTTCYYTTIKQLAMPAPIALTPGTDVTGTDNGEVKVYRFTSAADGTIFKATMTDASNLMDPAWVATRANAFHGLATDQGGAAPGPTRYIGAVDSGDAVDVIVDMEFNSSQVPVPFTISSYSIEASALPTNGSVTVTKQNGMLPADPIVGLPLRTTNYYYFDVDASTPVVHFDVTETEASWFYVFRTDIVDNELGEIDALVEKLQPNAGVQTFSGEFLYFRKPGRYYVGVFQDNGTAGDTYSMTSTLTAQGVATVAVGTPLNDEAISDVTGSTFKAFTPGTATWVEMTGGGANLGTDEDLEVLYYPLDREGWLDEEVPSYPLFDQTFAADGSTPAIGRITHNLELAPFLVRFRSTGGAAASQTFDYAIANRTFTDLATVTEAAPITMTSLTVPANGSTKFFVRATGRVTVATQNADFNAVIARLDYDEFAIDVANEINGVGDETLGDQKPVRGYIAFEIFDNAGTGGTFDLSVTALDAAPYTEICPSLGGQGTQILATVDDGLSATQTLPAAFDLFGDSVTMFKASSNGFISFDPTLPAGAYYQYTHLPDPANPNGIITPYWDDLVTQVCVRNTATRTIVEWNGVQPVDGFNVAFQLSIYQNGRLEFAYGPGHEEDGFFGVAGAENIAGNTGHELWYRQLGAMAPGTGEVVTLP